MNTERLLGVTVFPEYIQSEGIEAVLDNLTEKVGANAVAISPYLMEEANYKTGNREPPADAGAGAVRLLDRPLFGKREVWVRTAPSFVPDPALYKGLRYQPATPTELTRRSGQILNNFIHAAQSRHLKVYLQVQAAIPPGYRVQFGGPVEDDHPLLPDGRKPPKRLAKNGSLASPHILNYEKALLRDLIQNYPSIDGVRIDWPEYPPYFLDSVFLDFCDHAGQAAKTMGFDFEQMRKDARSLYAKLHGAITDDDLRIWTHPDHGRYALLNLLTEQPGISDWLHFKSRLVEQMLRDLRRAMDESGGRHMELMPNAFPPPFTVVSGMNFKAVAQYSSAISVKLYTMHWPMILRFYGDQIINANQGLSSKLLTRSLVALLDIADDEGLPNLTDYRYPEPNSPHPVGTRAQARKIEQAQRAANGTPIYALAHGYGPIEDFQKRIKVAHNTAHNGLWINRYAYLSDEKLDIIGRITGGK